jgi:hypothetical protein
MIGINDLILHRDRTAESVMLNLQRIVEWLVTRMGSAECRAPRSVLIGAPLQIAAKRARIRKREASRIEEQRLRLEQLIALAFGTHARHDRLNCSVHVQSVYMKNFSAEDLTYDGIHLHVEGERWLAKQWYIAVSDVARHLCSTLRAASEAPPKPPDSTSVARGRQPTSEPQNTAMSVVDEHSGSFTLVLIPSVLLGIACVGRRMTKP